MTKPRLTGPQSELLAEITAKSGLYVTRYKQFYRTVKALEKKGLVRCDDPDTSRLGQDHYVAIETPARGQDRQDPTEWAEMAVKRAVEGVGGFAAEMRQKGIHVGLGFGGSPGRCVTCAEAWPCSHMGEAEMDAAEAMNHIGGAVEEAMGESINSDPNGPPQPWLPLSVRYAAAEAAAKVVIDWRTRESAAPDSGSGGNER